jgi:hypothetical protein
VPYRVVILRAARDQLLWVLEERQLVAVVHVTWLG